MRGATRVGDGPLWVLTALFLLGVGGTEGLVGRQLAFGLLLDVVLYKVLKTMFGRPRPFQQILVVEQGARVPDEFSFPSGHMAAACVMVVIIGSAFSALLLPLLSLALLIGTSRVYLGMHYPSDVLAGGILGTSSGFVALTIV
jgi:undecaprenyl-diphosphatase